MLTRRLDRANALEALRRSQYKFPGRQKIIISKNWGFTPQPLHYSYRLKEGARLPEHNPSNPKYKLMIAAWKRLPLPVANLLGPRIVRGLG